MTGDITLFYLIKAKSYTFQGTASEGGVYEMTTVEDDLRLGSLIPEFCDSGPKFREFYRLSYGFFGKTNLTVPGAIVPLQLDYYIRKDVEQYNILMHLGDNDWNDAFRVQGLKVSTMESFLVSADFDDSSKISNIQFDGSFTSQSKGSLGPEVRALDLRSTEISLRGYYLRGGCPH